MSLASLDFERYSILKSIASGDDSWECDAKSIYSFTISNMAIECKMNNIDTFVLPDELFDTFRELDSQSMKERSKQNSELYELINGCIMSYGLIQSSRLKKIVTKHCSFEFNEDRFTEAMNGCEVLHGVIFVDEPLVYSRYFKEPKYYIKEQAKMKKYDYKEFSKEELIFASDIINVPDNPCYWRLTQLIKKSFKCSDEMSRASTAVLINYAKACRVLDESMEYIIKELGYVTGDFMGKFMPLYCEYNNCTGKWALKGHTPDDIMKIEHPEMYEKMQHMHDSEKGPGKVVPFMADQRPGRNEPCSCGSGKKYKNCCGRN